jgi:hypothetical protein
MRERVALLKHFVRSVLRNARVVFREGFRSAMRPRVALITTHRSPITNSPIAASAVDVELGVASE